MNDFFGKPKTCNMWPLNFFLFLDNLRLNNLNQFRLQIAESRIDSFIWLLIIWFLHLETFFFLGLLKRWNKFFSYWGSFWQRISWNKLGGLFLLFLILLQNWHFVLAVLCQFMIFFIFFLLLMMSVDIFTCSTLLFAFLEDNVKFLIIS